MGYMGIFQNKSVSQKQPSSKLQIIKKRLSEILARFSTKKIIIIKIIKIKL